MPKEDKLNLSPIDAEIEFIFLIRRLEEYRKTINIDPRAVGVDGAKLLAEEAKVSYGRILPKMRDLVKQYSPFFLTSKATMVREYTEQILREESNV